MRIFRLHRRARTVADYEGSLIYPGRWNPAGTPMLYASTALSLACLEVLVHLAPDQIPMDYVYTSADLGVTPEFADFRGSLLDENTTRRYGHRWTTDGRSVALSVPSAVIAIERNVLLNPVHSEFAEITWNASEPFAFDKRLLKTSTAIS